MDLVEDRADTKIGEKYACKVSHQIGLRTLTSIWRWVFCKEER